MLKWSVLSILFWCVIGIFSEFISNDDPILAQNDNKWSCPACKEWWNKNYESIEVYQKVYINPILPYDEHTLTGSPLKAPGESSSYGLHVLGTDAQSRDILTGIIYGAQVAIIIGFVSTLIALLIAFPAGMLAAYYRNKNYKLPPPLLILFGICIGLSLFYLSYKDYFFGISFFIAGIFVAILGKSNKGWTLNIEAIVMRSVEIMDSLPALLILLSLIAVYNGLSVFGMAVLIGLFRWPTFVRLIRSSLLPYTNSDWMRNLQNFNLSDLHIMLYQLSNLVQKSIWVHAIFIIISAIVLEATLSFLGLGLAADKQSWGGLLGEARNNIEAWWLILFPGLSLYSLLWALNKLIKKNSPSS